ncbi:MAG: hypothetical protein FWE88_00745 [Phycisphaerae bacterium]|nr:hypothetical protein [Phycisphaerae bacterium]
MAKTFEEYRVLSQPAAWALLFLLAGGILAWGLFVKSVIPNTPRVHNYGALPDAPGQSIYSTNPTPRDTTAPPQYQTLPEAKRDAGVSPALCVPLAEAPENDLSTSPSGTGKMPAGHEGGTPSSRETPTSHAEASP